jgi:hypothetical protein
VASPQEGPVVTFESLVESWRCYQPTPTAYIRLLTVIISDNYQTNMETKSSENSMGLKVNFIAFCYYGFQEIKMVVRSM